MQCTSELENPNEQSALLLLMVTKLLLLLQQLCLLKHMVH